MKKKLYANENEMKRYRNGCGIVVGDTRNNIMDVSKEKLALWSIYDSIVASRTHPTYIRGNQLFSLLFIVMFIKV